MYFFSISVSSRRCRRRRRGKAAALISVTQHVKPPKFEGKWGTEFPHTQVPSTFPALRRISQKKSCSTFKFIYEM